MIYPSKKDRWLVFAIAGTSLALVAGSFFFLLVEREVLPSLLLLLSGLFIVWPVFSTTYEITPAALVIRSGPFRWRILLHDIVAVSPTDKPLLAPAASLDRLRLNYQKKGKLVFVLVSPQDKERFLRELTEKVPGLEVAGNAMVIPQP